jgi:hypothetical protein
MLSSHQLQVSGQLVEHLRRGRPDAEHRARVGRDLRGPGVVDEVDRESERLCASLECETAVQIQQREGESVLASKNEQLRFSRAYSL